MSAFQIFVMRVINETALWVFLIHLGYGYWWSTLPVIALSGLTAIVWETRKR